MGKTKDLSAFERGMVVGARHTGLCQELQRCWVFHSTVSRVYQEQSTTQRTSDQLETTVGSIGVNMGQHPRGTLLAPCRVHSRQIEAILRAKGEEQINIRKAILMFCPLSVYCYVRSLIQHYGQIHGHLNIFTVEVNKTQQN